MATGVFADIIEVSYIQELHKEMKATASTVILHCDLDRETPGAQSSLTALKIHGKTWKVNIIESRRSECDVSELSAGSLFHSLVALLVSSESRRGRLAPITLDVGHCHCRASFEVASMIAFPHHCLLGEWSQHAEKAIGKPLRQ